MELIPFQVVPREVAPHFDVPGTLVDLQPIARGHINDTFVATYQANGCRHRVIHQRINHHIFRDPPRMMDNIARVTTHLQRKLADENLPDAHRRALRLIPTRNGLPYHRTDSGDYWRTYHYIENTCSYDIVESPNEAYQAAREFGLFQRRLADLPGPRLHDTIPDFHHTPKRFATFQRVLAADTHNRAATCRAEIAFAEQREPLTRVLLDLVARGLIPERVTHNDTKINNVLLDATTGEGVCVIDLDTVMPGLSLYDFGDLVRTTVSPAAEDETQLDRVCVRPEFFAALVRGYLEAIGDTLTPAEKQHLTVAGILITYEVGLRFLTDYLDGDQYFKTHRPGHNLDRCRNQFRLVTSLEQAAEELNAIIARH
ncbi:MAG: aminoglycoside phosphotransferase family protein [Verrucomicrobiae bacterium]|nr:aminoglycoside phosphotransferase family protein [Verrucomicrobiae bacterium]MDW8342945.1 aminoglycoside phosphotransferase family protein [Verrucomicrobiae bacterium]